MITKAGLKKMLHQVSLKVEQDPKELGCKLIRIKSLFIEAGPQLMSLSWLIRL
jgi:hypothetical protein